MKCAGEISNNNDVRVTCLARAPMSLRDLGATALEGQNALERFQEGSYRADSPVVCSVTNVPLASSVITPLQEGQTHLNNIINLENQYLGTLNPGIFESVVSFLRGSCHVLTQLRTERLTNQRHLRQALAIERQRYLDSVPEPADMQREIRLLQNQIRQTSYIDEQLRQRLGNALLVAYDSVSAMSLPQPDPQQVSLTGPRLRKQRAPKEDSPEIIQYQLLCRRVRYAQQMLNGIIDLPTTDNRILNNHPEEIFELLAIALEHPFAEQGGRALQQAEERYFVLQDRLRSPVPRQIEEQNVLTQARSVLQRRSEMNQRIFVTESPEVRRAYAQLQSAVALGEINEQTKNALEFIQQNQSQIEEQAQYQIFTRGTVRRHMPFVENLAVLERESSAAAWGRAFHSAVVGLADMVVEGSGLLVTSGACFRDQIQGPRVPIRLPHNILRRPYEARLWHGVQLLLGRPVSNRQVHFIGDYEYDGRESIYNTADQRVVLQYDMPGFESVQNILPNHLPDLSPDEIAYYVINNELPPSIMDIIIELELWTIDQEGPQGNVSLRECDTAAKLYLAVQVVDFLASNGFEDQLPEDLLTQAGQQQFLNTLQEHTVVEDTMLEYHTGTAMEFIYHLAKTLFLFHVIGQAVTVPIIEALTVRLGTEAVIGAGGQTLFRTAAGQMIANSAITTAGFTPVAHFGDFMNFEGDPVNPSSERQDFPIPFHDMQAVSDDTGHAATTFLVLMAFHGGTSIWHSMKDAGGIRAWLGMQF
ncbi:MAG: hypothetical protein ABH859_01520 [Pseudomonadota bacterium]